jgi:hypothetical protein
MKEIVLSEHIANPETQNRSREGHFPLSCMGSKKNDGT